MSTDPKTATTVDATPITIPVDVATPSTATTADAPCDHWGTPGTWDDGGVWGGPAPDPEPEAA